MELSEPDWRVLTVEELPGVEPDRDCAEGEDGVPVCRVRGGWAYYGLDTAAYQRASADEARKDAWICMAASQLAYYAGLTENVEDACAEPPEEPD